MKTHIINKEDFSIELVLLNSIIHSCTVNTSSRDFNLFFQNIPLEDILSFDTSILQEDEYPFFEALLEFFFEYIGFHFSNSKCLCLPEEDMKNLSLEDFLKYQKIFDCFSCNSSIRKFLKKDSFVCTCFSKTNSEILDFILENNCFNVDSLKENFSVGSKCVKCVPSLKNIFTQEFYIQSKPKVFWIKVLEDTLKNFFFRSMYSYEILSFYKYQSIIRLYPAFPVEERLLASLNAAFPFKVQFFFEYSQAE
jgi:bacterioferritin-associated ferredoxin